ncbi:nucleoside monophosphate kinase [Candidatus Saccharibacteria bacterium]|nr:nucleoside monophosphate kinase [Candidatus Saccharibacteria bacterium]
MLEQTKIIKKWLGAGSINIFGLPFSGKDTQCAILANMLGGVKISSGDILRHDHGNKKIQELMSSGGIIPSDLFEEVVLPFFSRPELKNRPLLLSSVGRSKGEETVILRASASSGHPTKAVIYLKVSEREVWERFEQSKKLNDRGKRQDDSKESLEKRLEEFRIKTKPVIKFYHNDGLLIEINGALPEKKVTEQILDRLERLAKLHS